MTGSIIDFVSLNSLYDRVAQITGKHAAPDGSDSVVDQLLTTADALDVIEGEVITDPYSDGFRPGVLEDLIRVRLYLRALANALAALPD